MLRLSDDIVFDKDTTDDESYLVNLSTGKLFRMNETAEIIIIAIKEEKSISQMQKKLCEITNGNKKTIIRDITNFIELMLEKGIIETDEFD